MASAERCHEGLKLLDWILPRTDAAVFLQVAIAVPVWLALLYLVRRRREAFIFVLGLGLFGAGLAALRAVH